jgi:hypothetical protein
MKTKILILLSLFTVQMAKSQYFDKKSSWTIITTNMFDDTFSEISTYKVDSDTLIGGKSYSKLLRNNNFYSALRETEDNKIYAYFSDLERELLIYDFDWHLNKTLYCQTSYEDNVIQAVLGNNIDSIQLLNGKYYKCVKNYAEEVSLIRGMGDTRGFFEITFEQPGNGDKRALLCFYIDDILIYSNPNFNYCNTSSINIVTDNNNKIKVYPNPSNNIVTIEFLENIKIDTFKIFDIKGSLIRIYETKGKSKIEVENLEKGIYMYFAIIKNNQNLSGKIIIK